MFKKMIGPFLLILLLPQVSFCWTVDNYERNGIGYVNAYAEYNGGYKFTIELPSSGSRYLQRPSWQIQATSDLQQWIELSRAFETYEVYIDDNPAGFDSTIKLTYDIGSNTAQISGKLSEPLLKAIQRGNAFRVKYDDFQGKHTLVSLSLKGSLDAIDEAVSERDFLREEYENALREKELKINVAIGVASLIGIFVALKILLWAFGKTKKIAKKVTNTSQEISTIVQNKMEEARRNRLYSKIEESVLDEIVREAVRQAIREGVRPDGISLCSKCLGEGCHQCNDKGWIAC